MGRRSEAAGDGPGDATDGVASVVDDAVTGYDGESAVESAVKFGCAGGNTAMG